MSLGASRTVLGAILLLGFAGVWQLQHAIDAQLEATHQEQDDLVLRSGPMLKAMTGPHTEWRVAVDATPGHSPRWSADSAASSAGMSSA